MNGGTVTDAIQEKVGVLSSLRYDFREPFTSLFMSQETPQPLPTSVPQPEEVLLWKGHSSQWIHFWFYLFCLILAVGIGIASLYYGQFILVGIAVPVVAAIIRWLVTKTTSYELTSQRLRRATGILNRSFDDLELFRVKDYTMEQPFLLRMFGLGNIRLVTSDSTTPEVNLRAIPGVVEVREQLRTAVQHERDRKRVRELDVDNPGSIV